ncbi:MAG TPA: VWA domain-containing protein [Blastocatellia bacterium]|nr:VWA domain-containing protein [Blastocatellia bacterium]
MKTRLSVSLALILSLFATALAGQQSQPAIQPPPSKEKQDAANKNDVVKISVTLVQVDVTVLDKKGKPVTDLKPEEFEVLQDNRPQRISNFSYVMAQPPAAPAAVAKPVDKNAPPEPPAPPPRLRPDQVRRTIALVVDDLTLSFGSTASVRDALKKYVDQQMQPGDLAAIIRTGAGMGALQQFTNDKRMLYAAIERVRWSPSRGTLYTFAPVATDPAQATLSALTQPNAAPTDFDRGIAGAHDLTGTFGARGPATDADVAFRQEVFSIGTLGALSFIVRGLKELPGRKSVVLFSDALRIYNREQNIVRVQQALNNLTDLANRASVSFYTIDARGLEVLGLTAADDLAGDIEKPENDINAITHYSLFTAKTQTALADRSREFFEAQEGLQYLADKTGGFFTRNNNDLNKGVERALRDQESYYLVGFVPEESTFKAKDGSREFHDIKVNVKREGVRVRTRTGFYGMTDEESRPLRGTPAQQLLTALASPFGASDIRVRMTSQFGYDAKHGHFMNALLNIDARDLQFEETVNGWRKVTFEIAAFTFGDNGRVVDQSDRAYTVSMSDKDYRRTLETGIFYRVNLPIKKPGAYQLRTAVRDHTSKKIGSANQFIEVPDVKKGRLTLSGMIVRGAETPSVNSPDAASAAAQAADTKEGRVEEGDGQAGPAVRRFRRGMVIEYGYMIYNAQTDKATGGQQLETQLRLYRDGRQVYASPVKPLKTVSEADSKRLIAGGSLRLGTDLVPGDYVLQVVVTDKLAKDKKQLVTQWTDFEIVK